MSLEDCIEQMSTVFLDFTNSVFKSKALQNDKELSQNLFAAISRIVALAKNASHESDQEGLDDSFDVNGPIPEKMQPMESRTDEVNGDSDSGSEPKSDQNNENVGLIKLAKHQLIRSPNTPGIEALQGNYSTTTGASDPQTIFGNGWFDQWPRIEGLDPSNIRTDQVEVTLSLKVTEITLRTAYFALLGEDSGFSELEIQIFRWALLYHTRDELLFNLRWFLGPGYSSLPVLGQANFGFEDAESDDGLPNILNPSVDVLAAELSRSESMQSSLLNATGIEHHLRRMGAYHFDQNVVKIEIQSPEDLSSGFIVQEDDALLPQDLDAVHSSRTFEIPVDVSNLPSFQKFPYSLQASPDQELYLSPPSTRQLVTLNMPLLLQNLAKISICLGKGPGYFQKDVDQAIVASVLQMTAA